MNKISVQDIQSLKGKRKITALTAYDYPTASLIDKAGIDIILVGDSVANVVLGLESTTQVGMPEMLHHAKAVTRAVVRALVVGDMPFDAYQRNPAEAAGNAAKFITEAGCDAVKIEWFDRCIEVTSSIIKQGIPVMGHIGLTPQTAVLLGGFTVQGKDARSASALIAQAQALQDAGCFAVVLECIPDKIAGLITKARSIPTIGIGAGALCDGQVLVTHDLLGLFTRFKPKFVKQYSDIGSAMLAAFTAYKNEVEQGDFPLSEHSFSINDEEFKKISTETPGC